MAKNKNAAADEQDQPSADSPAEEQPMPESKPAPHVPDDQQFAEYKVALPDSLKSRKGVVVVRFPMKGYPDGFPVTFMRPDQTTRTVKTNAAVAQQLKTEGWLVEKVS